MLLTGINKADSYFQFITVLVLFVFVLGITYITTRWIANYQKGKTAGGNLEVVETMRITSNKYVQIVRAGNKYLVIAVGKDEIHMLAELSEDELMFADTGAGSDMDFGSILDKFKRLSRKDDD